MRQVIEKENLAVRGLKSIIEQSGVVGGHIEFYQLQKQTRGFYRRKPEEAGEFTQTAVLDWLGGANRNLNCVVMVTSAASITDSHTSDEHAIIASKPLYERRIAEDYQICPDTMYARQRSAFCYGSGFFVKEKETGEKIVATAAHLVVRPGLKIEDLRFVHGVCIRKDNDFQHEILVHKSQIYKPVAREISVLDYELYATGGDWALLAVAPAYAQFDKSELNLYIPKIQTEPVDKADSLYAFGHGLGLPLKVSLDGNIITVAKSARPLEERDFFESTISLLGGNSGSPVFSSRTHQLVGLYMRGTKKLKKKVGKDNCLEVKNDFDFYEGLEGQECLRVDKESAFYKRLQTI